MSEATHVRARLHDLLGSGRIVPEHQTWPRAVVSHDTWRRVTSLLSCGDWVLLGLWADGEHVHMAVADESHKEFGVASVECPDRRFPSVGQSHPPAARLERVVRESWGLEPEGLADGRPWLNHGKWNPPHNLAAGWKSSRRPNPYAFLAAEGESLHQIAVGPVHAGIIEPGHFRFTANGEAVVRLEARLGYVHKGTEWLMEGMTVEHAALLAGRVSGDSTVAFALAFARAIESAHDIQVPPRAAWLRALMSELERLANHFGDIGAICNDAAFAMMHAHCGYLREQVLRVADKCFGHRLMMDRVVPGGVQSDLHQGADHFIRALLKECRSRFPELVELYENTASLQDRTVGTGILSAKLARQFGCGGYVGRASGRSFDARRSVGYPPYDALQFEVPALEDGDVDARVWIRIREVEQSMALIDQILQRLPAGPIAAPPAAASGTRAHEGVALVEGFRGDVLVWVRTGVDGTIERCHLRDPSWFQWPVLEAAIEANIVADFPLCNKSFNCSYSGHDL